MVNVFHLVKQSAKPLGFLLALLDYVRRAHGMGSLSVVRPSVASIIYELIAWTSSNFGFCFPWGICRTHLIVTNIFVTNRLKSYSSLKSLLNPFKLFMNFLLNGPHKSTVLNFWNFDVLIFQDFSCVFVNMGPYGSQKFKTLLPPQITFESFQNFSEFSSQWSSQKYCFESLKFWVFDFSDFFVVFVNMGLCFGFLKFWVYDF